MYQLTVKDPQGLPVKVCQLGSWLDHCRELYGAERRKTAPNHTIELKDIFSGEIVLSDKGQKGE